MTAAVRGEIAGTGLSAGTALPGTVHTSSSRASCSAESCPPSIPGVSAVVRSRVTLRAGTPVPLWTGGYEAVAALTPRPRAGLAAAHTLRGDGDGCSR